MRRGLLFLRGTGDSRSPEQTKSGQTPALCRICLFSSHGNPRNIAVRLHKRNRLVMRNRLRELRDNLEANVVLLAGDVALNDLPAVRADQPSNASSSSCRSRMRTDSSCVLTASLPIGKRCNTSCTHIRTAVPTRPTQYSPAPMAMPMAEVAHIPAAVVRPLDGEVRVLEDHACAEKRDARDDL